MAVGETGSWAGVEAEAAVAAGESWGEIPTMVLSLIKNKINVSDF